MPMAMKLSKGVTYNGWVIKSRDLLSMWSRDELKTYLAYYNANGNQTWQGGYIQKGTSFHKVTIPFDYVVLQVT